MTFSSFSATLLNGTVKSIPQGCPPFHCTQTLVQLFCIACGSFLLPRFGSVWRHRNFVTTITMCYLSNVLDASKKPYFDERFIKSSYLREQKYIKHSGTWQLRLTNKLICLQSEEPGSVILTDILVFHSSWFFIFFYNFGFIKFV